MGHFIQHSYPFYITSIYLQGENNIIMFQYLLTAYREYIQSNSIQGFNQTKPVSHPLKTEILAGARAKQTERLLPITSCEACTFLVAISSFDFNVFFMNRFSNQFQDVQVNQKNWFSHKQTCYTFAVQPFFVQLLGISEFCFFLH